MLICPKPGYSGECWLGNLPAGFKAMDVAFCRALVPRNWPYCSARLALRVSNTEAGVDLLNLKNNSWNLLSAGQGQVGAVMGIRRSWKHILSQHLGSCLSFSSLLEPSGTTLLACNWIMRGWGEQTCPLVKMAPHCLLYPLDLRLKRKCLRPESHPGSEHLCPVWVDIFSGSCLVITRSSVLCDLCRQQFFHFLEWPRPVCRGCRPHGH